MNENLPEWGHGVRTPRCDSGPKNLGRNRDDLACSSPFLISCIAHRAETLRSHGPARIDQTKTSTYLDHRKIHAEDADGITHTLEVTYLTQSCQIIAKAAPDVLVEAIPAIDMRGASLAEIQRIEHAVYDFTSHAIDWNFPLACALLFCGSNGQASCSSSLTD